MSTTIYQVAPDPSAPGSYTVINGQYLVEEGECTEEEFANLAEELRDCYEDDSLEFALVQEDEDGNREILAWA